MTGGADIDQRAGSRVDQVILSARRMVDRISAAAGRAPFKAQQLRDHARVVEQIDLAGIQAGQEIAINLRLVQIGGAIFDARFLECLSDPLSSISIAADASDAIGLQQRRELGDRILRR